MIMRSKTKTTRPDINISLLISCFTLAFLVVLDEPLAHLTHKLFGTFALGIFINLFFKKHLVVFIAIFLLFIPINWFKFIIKRRNKVLFSIYLLLIFILIIWFSSAKSFYIDLSDYLGGKKMTISATIKNYEILEHRGARTTSHTVFIILDNNDDYNVNAFTSVISEEDIGRKIELEYLEHSKRVINVNIFESDS